MILKDWLSLSEQILDHEKIATARLDAQLLAEKVLKLNKAQLLAHDDQTLTSSQEQRLNALMAERIAHKPMSQISGTKEFYGRDFAISNQVLAPRPESEAMIDYAIAHIPFGADVIDVGTGSGALAITLKLERPDLNVRASDISAMALKQAQQNAQNLGAKVTFETSDLLKDIQGRFGAVLANLPYLTPAQHKSQPELSHEPTEALLAGPEGLDLYKELFKQLPTHLHEHGLVLIEHMPKQRQPLTDLATRSQLELNPVSEFISKLTLNA